MIADADGRGEGGLLGLALGPDGGLYVYFSTPTDNRIERYDLEGSPGSFALGDHEVIIDGLPVAGNHNGGRIAFGPDGMLYVGVGDAAQRDRAQDLDDLGGKILRLTPEGGIPDDNPFPGSPVWSYGHRNVQGLAWAADGTMFATEFGQNTWDELNIIEPGGNYGWPIVEGQGGGDDFIDPVQQWTPDAASPSGMAIIGDTIFIANLRGEVLRAVPIGRPVAAHRLLPARVRAAPRCGRWDPTATCGSSRTTPTAAALPGRTTTASCASRSDPDPPDRPRNKTHAPTNRGSPHLIRSGDACGGPPDYCAMQ